MHAGDPSSLYIKPRHWENCFSSRAADTEKASPPPSRRHEILEFMHERVKGGQALGHYDGCKAGDCHMYAHTIMHQFDRVLHIYMSVIHARRRESSRYPVWIYTPRFHTPDQIRASSGGM